MTEITVLASAERLRDAADRLDALAEAAPDGEWELHRHVPGCLYLGNSPYPIDGPLDTVTYIAAMHPGVGKALAAWLRDEASYRPQDGRDPRPALAVADAILGASD